MGYRAKFGAFVSNGMNVRGCLNILKPSGQTAWDEVVINHQNLPRCVSVQNFVSVARNE